MDYYSCMISRIRSGMPLVFVVAFETAAVVSLYRLGASPGLGVEWRDLGGWLGRTDPQDALAAAVRVVALGVACWLLLTTVVYLVVAVARMPGAVRGVGWTMLPSVRRLVDGVVAGSLVAGLT